MRCSLLVCNSEGGEVRGEILYKIISIKLRMEGDKHVRLCVSNLPPWDDALMATVVAPFKGLRLRYGIASHFQIFTPDTYPRSVMKKCEGLEGRTTSEASGRGGVMRTISPLRPFGLQVVW